MDQLTWPASHDHSHDWSEPAVVHQASGMVSARNRISCAEALSALRRHAGMTGQPLLALAAAVVAGSVDPVLGGMSYR